MDQNKLQEHMLLYGADIQHWPEAEQGAAREVLSQNPALREMLEEAHLFETQARVRPALREDASFAERIIAAAQTRAPVPTRKAVLWQMLDEMIQALPFAKPGYALASFALAGLLLGILSQPDIADASIPNNFLYEVGEVL